MDPMAMPETWDLIAPGYSELNVEFFEHYARDAISLCGIGPKDRVVDVASGPGSLSLLVANIAERVDALDFSPEMLAHLGRRAAEKNIGNIKTHCGDGQQLPFEDRSFDAGFSMFGLIFFPDRAAGFRELHRVLKPGGRCVVASWHAPGKHPMFKMLFEALCAELPDLPKDDDGRSPLDSREEFEQEMGDGAGFDVKVHRVSHDMHAPSLHEFLANLRRTFMPLVLLENHFGTAFEPIAAGVLGRLEERFGPGPVSIPMEAWLAEGRK